MVNHDDCEGTAPDPLVWSAGALSKRRRLVYAVRDYAMLPGPAFIRTSDWVSVLPAITAEDVGPWPSSVGILVKLVTFRCTLRWSAAGADWGLEGFPMWRCFSCMSFGQAWSAVLFFVQALIFGDHAGSVGL